ncbi:hypothetical protein NLG97_g8057 [Lecanicillium saksenae]|uniref:Uncharacterized protein n=1 Tax=Lecanicillium saksenae TaxID=468837 RepID=A0ACC1QNV9_9HYPO|nr:hypothetical protein NLG97_g8057 [Lecanicillium saksenae]
MTFYITQVLDSPATRAVLQQLGYEDGFHAENMLIDLDNFLKDYTTTNEVNGTEPCSTDEDAKELADIVTVWLDDKKQGRLRWPLLDPRDYPGHLRYDDQDHPLITDLVRDLVCALNRARQRFARKRYVAIAQASLITARRGEGSRVEPGLTNSALCRYFSKMLGFADRASNNSIDIISKKLQALLLQDKVVGVSILFLPLKCYRKRAQQVKRVTEVLNCLKDEGVISAIGHSDEERLHIAAETCAMLCFKLDLELPPNLEDEELPDLLSKLAIKLL